MQQQSRTFTFPGDWTRLCMLVPFCSMLSFGQANDASIRGEKVKITSQIASRWVKAAFLAVLGLIILLFLERFVRELRESLSDSVQFDLTWDLLRILLWVLVAWLFVDAALTIVLSFTERRYTLMDVMQKLEAIEKKLGPQARQSKKEAEVPLPQVIDEEVPPPPRE